MLAVNIKADGLQAPLARALAGLDGAQWFAFDMSVPDALGYVRAGLPTFTRHSDVEPDPVLLEDAHGVWLDDFGGGWLGEEQIAAHLAAGRASGRRLSRVAWSRLPGGVGAVALLAGMGASRRVAVHRSPRRGTRGICMNQIKAVLFDMDGVLIDAREWHYEALNRALALLGYEISRYEHLTTFDGLPTARKLQMLTVERGLPAELHAFINSLKQQYTLELVATSCKPVFHHEFALAQASRRPATEWASPPTRCDARWRR